MTGLLPLSLFTGWLASGSRGISSDAIVSHLTGEPVGSTKWEWRADHPHDPADLRRCERLLDAVPLARLAFPSMSSRSPVWAALVDAWDELTSLLVEEEPTGRAPRCYARMREVIESAAVKR